MRVYELARELQIESKELRRFLGRSAPSAASVVDSKSIAAARRAFAAGVVSTPPCRPETRQCDDGWDDDDPWRRCPAEVSTAEAARLCMVKETTIRQWAARGYLAAVGKRGRSTLYDSVQLRRVQFAVVDRTRVAPPPRAGVLRSRDLDALVPGSDAAVLAGVAPSTIRMWVLRGRLRPVRGATTSSGRPLFRVGDVLVVARRRR